LNDSTKQHWDRIYASERPTGVSWYQPVPARSLALIRATGASLTAAILDVGGGTSPLVDHLLDAGYEDVSVLDIAGSALDEASDRLRAGACCVAWIKADVTEFEPPRAYAVWHDRAVFHFLTEPAERDRYLDVLRKALEPRGHFILATFGPDGPTRCSGLEVQRYSAEQIDALLGQGFERRADVLEEHRTPMGTAQQFLYGWWQAEA
jgi:trans-aconitate methyltransferase